MIDDLKIENEVNKKISIAIVSPFVILTIQYFILINVNLIGTGGAASIQLLSKILVIISFIYALPTILRRNLMKIVITYSILMSIFLLHLIIFPENQAFQLALIIDFFFMSVPLFIYSNSLTDYKIFYEVLIKASSIIFYVGSILAFESIIGVVDLGNYSGPLANYLIIPTIIFFNQYMNRPSVKTMIYFLLSISIIIIMGTRGPLLTFIFFLFTKLLFSLNKAKTSNYIRYFGLILILVATVFPFDKLLLLLNNILLTYGIESRTLRLFMEEDLYLSGRDSIYNIIVSEIAQSPVIGFGIAGDRRILSIHEFVYAHNIVLEVLGNFGIILGVLLLLALLTLIIKNFIIKNNRKKEIILIWLSLGLVHLMISSSYIIEMKFWILLGILANNNKIPNTYLKKE